MQANKGEWSELYTLFKIFLDKGIAAADKNLNPTDDKYIFLQVLREDEPGHRLIYDLEQPDSVAVCETLGQAIKIIPTNDLLDKTKKIFEKIKNNTDGASFSIPEAVDLMHEYEIKKIKANSSHKSDIDAIVKDKIASRQELGFSIKSQVGSPSTLLNASSQTNFLYEITGFKGTLDEVNNINGVMGKIVYLRVMAPR